MTRTLRFPASGRLADAIARTVRQEIWNALSRHTGDRAKSAAYLGVSRRYLADFIASDTTLSHEWPSRPVGRPRKPVAT